MGPTARNVLRELLTWALVALMAAALLYFYNDLRGLLAPPLILAAALQCRRPAMPGK